MSLDRPTDAQPHYGEHLGDVEYWAPFVREILGRHSLPTGHVEPPYVGTFPTFLVGDLVVKVFGTAFDGDESSQVEIAMHALLDSQPDIPAPSVVAAGQLFDTHPTWPYLVTERVRGRAIREVQLDESLGEQVAAALGAIVRRLHELTPPATVDERGLLDNLRAEAPTRLRRFGLPDHLVQQVPDFLADAETPTILVHGDITADHVFVDDQGLTAVIDWGDALVADRAYELPAIYLDAFRGDRRLLATFIDAADWPRDNLARRGLQGILEIQFNAVNAIAERIDLAHVRTLDELAERLFARSGTA